jgi:hypothetical protein
MREKIERMLAEAERDFDRAAAAHAMGKVSHAAGRIAALKAVLDLL